MSERDDNSANDQQVEPAETVSPDEKRGPIGVTAAHRRRFRLAALVVGVAALSALATYGFLRGGQSQSSLCTRADDRLAEVWSQDRKKAVEERFLATKRPYAADTYQRVTRAVDAYASAWAAMHAAACETEQGRGEQSRSLLDLRTTCLEHRLGELAALVDVFAVASDPEVVDEAVRATSDLGDLSSCEDAEALTATVPPPTDAAIRTEVEWTRTQLDRAVALERVGKYEPALTSARGAAESARAIDYAPIRALALRRLGALEARVGSAEAAERALREAAQTAAQARDDNTAAECWIELMALLAQRGARYDEALALQPTAVAAVARAGDRPLQRAALSSNLGALHLAKGEYEKSRELYQQALSFTTEALGPEHLDVATAMTALGDALVTLGSYDDALRELERAHAITEKSLGADHPEVARALAALANVYGNQGRYADAEAYYQRALAVYERALGAHHPQVAKSLYNIGVAVGEQNRLEESLSLFLRALEIQMAAIGHAHPDTVWTINSIGVILQRQHRLGLARARFTEALTLFENTLGKDHPNVGYPLNNLGEIAVLEGRFSDALELCQRAHAVGVDALGADHPALAHELTCMGAALTGLRRPTEAIAPLESALSVREANPGNPRELADTRFALARALWDSRRDRKRAIELAGLAQSGYAEAGAIAEEQRAAVDAWLTRRAGRAPRGRR